MRFGTHIVTITRRFLRRLVKWWSYNIDHHSDSDIYCLVSATR